MKLIFFVIASVLDFTSQHVIQKRQSQDKRLVCYTANWNVYRPGEYKFTGESIDPFLCTHIIYAFIKAGVEDRNLISIDSWSDIDLGGFEKVTELKEINPSLSIMVSVGGWNEGTQDFSQIAATPDSREIFVQNAIEFLRKHNFDGLDLDWQYPAQRTGGVPEDKENYAALIKKFREEFDADAELSGRPRLQLSLVISALEGEIEGFDIPTVEMYTDFVNLVSYNYFTSTGAFVHHHSPLYPLLQDIDDPQNSVLNGDASVRRLLKIGLSPQKINFGIPTYGRHFILEDPHETDPGSLSGGQGEAKSTEEKGYIPYYEVCQKKTWTVKIINATAMGPYAYRDTSWVGYDDVDSVRRKAEYAKSKNLGGLVFWTIDDDDFLPKCHNIKFPLINSGRSAFLEGSAPKGPTTEINSPVPTSPRATSASEPPSSTTSASEPPSSTTSAPEVQSLRSSTSVPKVEPPQSEQPPQSESVPEIRPPQVVSTSDGAPSFAHVPGLSNLFSLSSLFGRNGSFPSLPFPVLPNNIFFQSINITINNYFHGKK